MAKRKGPTYSHAKTQLVNVSRKNLQKQLDFVRQILPKLAGRDSDDAEEMITALEDILNERNVD